MMSTHFLLRFSVAFILIMHSVPGMLDGGVNDFGNLYLNQIGFAPLGLALAWTIKISHVACALFLMVNRFIIVASSITIFILVMGIIMVHSQEGWFVVGGGRNGIEYNFLLICVLIQIVFNSIKEKKALQAATNE